MLHRVADGVADAGHRVEPVVSDHLLVDRVEEQRVPELLAAREDRLEVLFEQVVVPDVRGDEVDGADTRLPGHPVQLLEREPRVLDRHDDRTVETIRIGFVRGNGRVVDDLGDPRADSRLEKAPGRAVQRQHVDLDAVRVHVLDAGGQVVVPRVRLDVAPVLRHRLDVRLGLPVGVQIDGAAGGAPRQVGLYPGLKAGVGFPVKVKY